MRPRRGGRGRAAAGGGGRAGRRGRGVARAGGGVRPFSIPRPAASASSPMQLTREQHAQIASSRAAANDRRDANRQLAGYGAESMAQGALTRRALAAAARAASVHDVTEPCRATIIQERQERLRQRLEANRQEALQAAAADEPCSAGLQTTEAANGLFTQLPSQAQSAVLASCLLAAVTNETVASLREPCPSCTAEYQVGEQIARFPCLHTAHATCLYRWLAADLEADAGFVTWSLRCHVCRTAFLA